MARLIEFRRGFPCREFRAVEAEKRRVEGYAVVFDSETSIGDRFTEVIRKGAFAKTLQEADIRGLWQHESLYPLCRTANGTLELREDDKGLWFAMDLADTSWGRDAYASISRGDVTGMSFGFDVIKETWTESEEHSFREIQEVRLWEVSPVTWPAYEATEVEARSIMESRGVSAVTPEPVLADHSGADVALATAIRERELVLEAQEALCLGV